MKYSSSPLETFFQELDSDIKDPLTVIKFTIEKMQMEYFADKGFHQKTDLVLAQVDRIIQVLTKAAKKMQEL